MIHPNYVARVTTSSVIVANHKLPEIKMARSAPTGYYLEPTDSNIPTAVSSDASVSFFIPNQFPHVDYYHIS
jgi:hypothetical protein